MKLVLLTLAVSWVCVRVCVFASLQKYRHHVQEYEFVPVGGLHWM